MVRHTVRALCVLFCLSVAGCGLLLDPDSRPPGADGSRDGGAADAAPRDADPGDSASPGLDGSLDGAPPGDATVSSDSGVIGVVTCPDSPSDVVTVAHYTFDRDPAGVIVDETGAHDGLLIGNTPYITGPCGQALSFAAGGNVARAIVEDAPEFHVREGSIELLAMVPSHTSLGVLSRDYLGNDTTGHLAIFVSAEGRFVLRMQHTEEDNAVWLCAHDTTPVGAWAHLGVSFGGPTDVQFWVDHVPADHAGTAEVVTGG
ncbi:MAG: hypothetical protein JRH11_19675, partial [Deltaproteobacteria bacterium]|nr:hypothetical protein [Deltaproteobacteria bacterium]